MALNVVDLGGGVWGLDSASPDAFIVALGDGNYGIDPDVSLGAIITADGDAFVFALGSTTGAGKRRYWIDVQRDATGRVIGWVTNSPVI